jgi:hypothetical protein
MTGEDYLELGYVAGYERGLADAHHAIGKTPFGWISKADCYDEIGRVVRAVRAHDMSLVLGLLEDDAPTEEIVFRPCPVCKGTVEHVIGCPEQDKPR